MHDNHLITTVAFGLGAALVLGLLAKRIGLSPIVGYLLAGIAAGPHTPGFVGNTALAQELAEIGVILLMFGVGLHFHLKDLIAVRWIAIPGALGQIAAAALATLGIAVAAGMDWKGGLVLGIAVSVASTVVLVRALTDHRLLDSPQGHVAVGWLVVEDIVTVLILVLLPPLAARGHGEASVLKTLAVALVKLAVLTAIIMLGGARIIPWLLTRVARLRSRELFTLCVLVLAICVATLSYELFGASMALGAFLAGMVVGQSRLSHQAAADALPLKDAFAVLFFVAVGMLFDFHIVAKEPLLLIGVVLVILLLKPLVALAIVLVSGHSLLTGLTVAGGLAQIGEFSFILGEMAKSLGLMPGEGHDVIVASAIISITLNPFLFPLCIGLEPKLKRVPWLASFEARRHGKSKENVSGIVGATAGSVHQKVIVVGYGPVGQAVVRQLDEKGLEPVVIDLNVDTILQLEARGKSAVFGDATNPEILNAAGVKRVSCVVTSLPQLEANIAIIHAVKTENPEIRILARASYFTDIKKLEEAGASSVACDETGTAAALCQAVEQMTI